MSKAENLEPGGDNEVLPESQCGGGSREKDIQKLSWDNSNKKYCQKMEGNFHTTSDKDE